MLKKETCDFLLFIVHIMILFSTLSYCVPIDTMGEYFKSNIDYRVSAGNTSSSLLNNLPGIHSEVKSGWMSILLFAMVFFLTLSFVIAINNKIPRNFYDGKKRKTVSESCSHTNDRMP
jgi:hypothetical protein